MNFTRQDLDFLHDILDLHKGEHANQIKAKIPPPMPEWRQLDRDGTRGVYEWMDTTVVTVVVEDGVLCEIEFRSDEPLDLEAIRYFPLDNIIKDME